MVAGVYKSGKFVPHRFQWRSRTHDIDRVTFTADLRDGGVRWRHYAVQSGANLYRLRFNREEETWFLMEVWCE